LAAAAAILAPSVSLANDDLLSGLWRVSGRVATFDFSVTCRLERHGDQLGGACLEGREGKAHPLTGGSVAGEQLCQHHCPVAHVAAEFPQLCEAETEAFGRLLGTPVQRLATIAHGDGICTTHVTSVGKAGKAGTVVTPVTNEVTAESGGLLT
jgi:hypothetical protein